MDYNKKIVIEFDKELVGDLSGKQAAFTVTGQELNHINGSLVAKTYQVISTEPYLDLRTNSVLVNSFTTSDLDYDNGLLTLHDNGQGG